MQYSIRMKLLPVDGEIDPSKSHFFGAPLIPGAWIDDFEDSVMFFCQINLSEASPYDPDGKLPKQGYLYVFFDTANEDYFLMPIVRYFDGEPDTVIDDFNNEVEEYESFTEPLAVEFSQASPGAYCMKLLGVPSDWNYPDAPPELLMQIDHLDDELCFHDEMDGVTYLFFGKDRQGFSDVEIYSEYS